MDIKKSILYQLKNKKFLFEDILKMPYTKANLNLFTSDSLYKVFLKEFPDKPSKKPRNVQQPTGDLKTIHERFKMIFSKIEKPAYLFSGVKRKSYKDNAVTHLGARYVITIDIEDFYRSCNRKLISSGLKNYFELSPEVADVISKILSYDDFIPTGSPSSQIVAYLSCKPTFDRINEFCEKNGIKFSLYVDDLTFSSDRPFYRTFEKKINQILQKETGLNIKLSKTKKFNSSFSEVTGAIIRGDTIHTPHKTKAKIFEILNQDQMLDKDLNSLVGLVMTVNFIEKNSLLVLRAKLLAEQRIRRLKFMFSYIVAKKYSEQSLFLIPPLYKNNFIKK